jgi:hypothetical protein
LRISGGGASRWRSGRLLAQRKQGHVAVVGLLALAGLGLAAGCESLITGGPLIREGEPTGIIRVVNGSSHVVDNVLISDCDASTYGLNRMGDGEKIYPGQSRDFTVSAGCWDVDAGSFSGGEARMRMNVEANGGVEYTVN